MTSLITSWNENGVSYETTISLKYFYVIRFQPRLILRKKLKIWWLHISGLYNHGWPWHCQSGMSFLFFLEARLFCLWSVNAKFMRGHTSRADHALITCVWISGKVACKISYIALRNNSMPSSSCDTYRLCISLYIWHRLSYQLKWT